MSKNKQMREAREGSRVAGNRHSDAIQVAAIACRPFVAMDVPRDLFELAYVIEHSSRMPATYPGHAKARSILARGIPVGSLTRRDGSSSAPVMNTKGH